MPELAKNLGIDEKLLNLVGIELKTRLEIEELFCFSKNESIDPEHADMDDLALIARSTPFVIRSKRGQYF